MGFLRIPEGVRGYVERRSLFVAKRLQNQEKSNKKRFFNQINSFCKLKSSCNQCCYRLFAVWTFLTSPLFLFYNFCHWCCKSCNALQIRRNNYLCCLTVCKCVKAFKWSDCEIALFRVSLVYELYTLSNCLLYLDYRLCFTLSFTDFWFSLCLGTKDKALRFTLCDKDCTLHFTLCS